MFPLVDRQMHANYSEHSCDIFIFSDERHSNSFLTHPREPLDWTLCNTFAFTNISLHFFSTDTPQLPFEFVEFSFRGRLPLISCLQKLYQFISFHSVFIFDLFAEKTNIIFTQKFVPKRILNSLSVNFLFLDVYLNCVNIHFILQNILQPGISDARSSDYTPRTRHRWHSSVCR